MTHNMSVVIPTFNRSHLVTRAVASVLPQLAAGDELIVVDDGSTDNTEAVLKPYRDAIRYIKATHAGCGAARNCGIHESKNELIALLDSDDAWLPGKLDLQRAFMQARPDVLFCFTDFVIEDGRRTWRRGLSSWDHASRTWQQMLGRPIPFSRIAALPDGCADCDCYIGDLYQPLMEGPCVPTISLVVRREAAGAAFRYPEDLRVYEDWECHARLARQGPGAFLDLETAVNYGHRGPRLTDMRLAERTAVRLGILNRVWGSDAAFLRQHGEAYARICAGQRLLRINLLIANGRTREARLEIAAAGGAPFLYRAMAALPGWAVVLLLGVRRHLKRWLGRGPKAADTETR